LWVQEMERIIPDGMYEVRPRESHEGPIIRVEWDFSIIEAWVQAEENNWGI